MAHRTSNTILLASNNRHKKIEIARVLEGYAVLTPAERGLEFECEETGVTFLENALLKARSLAAIAETPVIADDSGLCVPSLGGRPGVLSARFGADLSRPPGSDAERNEYLLSLLPDDVWGGSHDKGGPDDRADAYFVCCMVLLCGPERFVIVQETVQGRLVRTPRGEGGFGYDPIFFIPELGKTAAELTLDEKNSYSHRGRAAARIKQLLDDHLHCF